MREKNEAPLVVGSAYGIRAFRTTSMFSTRAVPGQLWPLTDFSGASWRPGWNNATCPYWCGEKNQRQRLAMEARIHTGWIFMPTMRSSSGPATVGMDCSCGFHAYTDPERLSAQVTATDNDSSLVVGIVEGAGTTVVATHGFRSRRVRVVALIAPRWHRAWTVQIAVMMLCLLLIAYLSTSMVATGWDWWTASSLALNGAAVGGNCVVLHRVTRGRRHVRRACRAFNVPMFTSRQSAMEAFPLGLGGPDRKGLAA